MPGFATRAFAAANRIAWNTWGKLQLTAYNIAGDPAYLKEAVRLLQQALDVMPHDHPDRARYLAHLGLALHKSFYATGETADLAEAARILREAEALTASGRRHRAECLEILGLVLLSLYRQTGELSVLTEAVHAQRDALASTAVGRGWRRGERLAGLALSLMTMYEEEQRDPEILTDAVQAIRESLAATPRGPLYRIDRASRLGTLGGILSDMFDQTDNLEILDEIVQVLRECIATYPSDHPDRNTPILLFGHTLITVHKRNDDQAALTEAREAFNEVASSELADSSNRCDGNHGLGIIATLAGDATTALECYENAVAILPQIAPRRLGSPDRQRSLGSTSGLLAADAAASAVAAGRPARAIELLEQARALLLSERMGARGDLTELESLAPELALRFTRIRDAMDTLEPVGQDLLDNLDKSLQLPSLGEGVNEAAPYKETRRISDQRQNLAAEWDDLITQIHAIPGLEEFLLPLSIQRLQEQAIEGPVVFVNISEHRCDALILSSDVNHPVRHVALQAVTSDEIYYKANNFEDAINASLGASFPEQSDGQREILNTLAWLWDEIAEPVLEDLGISGAPRSEQQWPRIWWCPVGEIARLPLHAAGYHSYLPPGSNAGNPMGSSAPAVLDRVISSYTPTIRALRYARHSRFVSPADHSAGALIVAMPETPLAPALPGAEAEARFLANLLPGSQTLSGPRATCDAVLAAVPYHRIAHLACHGITDRHRPASSRLLLYDHAEHPFTVTNISRLHLTGAELAFLSACSTSDTSPSLRDEAVHITAAFQLAGYQNVIGTLWPVIDEVAARTARRFYSNLTAAVAAIMRTRCQVDDAAWLWKILSLAEATGTMHGNGSRRLHWFSRQHSLYDEKRLRSHVVVEFAYLRLVDRGHRWALCLNSLPKL